jgi:maltose O-acetyltransferase
MIRHFINVLLYFMPPSRMFALRRMLLRMSDVRIEDGVRYCGRGWIYGRGQLNIGRNTWLSPGTVFHTHLNGHIAVGADCDIGPSVEFIVGSHDVGSSERRAGKETANSIAIGDGCWIGAGSKILDGVSIGPGCVVAAGAIVITSMPANSLVAGVPAAVKKVYS